jgi:arylsulfatase A-like enzyme
MSEKSKTIMKDYHLFLFWERCSQFSLGRSLVTICMAVVMMMLTGFQAAEGTNERPNIIIIMTDDQGWGDTGYNGNREVKTPNIDRLAASGVRFDNAYVTAPQCIPSRAGIILGRYQQRFGVECNPDEKQYGTYQLPSGVATMPQELQRAGYRTGIVGKWHLGEPIETQPFNKGFEWCAYFREGMGFQYATDGKEKLFRNERDEIIPVGPDQYLVNVFTRKAFEFIEQKDERPFFLYLSYYPPHWPLKAPARYMERYNHIEDVNRRTACAMISSVDDAVGEVMGRLAESGLAQNTLVVFISDNGAPVYNSQGVTPIKLGQNASSNEPLSGYKGNLLEGGIRVPFLMSWPSRLPAGRAVSWPVSTLDFTPTFLAAAGAAPMKDTDGVNLLPYLSQTISDAGPDRALFWRFYTQQCLQGAVRRGSWKLVSAGPEPGSGFDFPPGSLRSGEIGLFNIADDPSEKKNLIADHPEIAASLEKEFAEWNKKLIDPKWVTLHKSKSGP